MSDTVKMMKEADVHRDQVAEFERHGWVVVDPLTGLPFDAERQDGHSHAERGNDGEVQEAQPDMDVKPAKSRARAKK